MKAVVRSLGGKVTYSIYTSRIRVQKMLTSAEAAGTIKYDQ